MQVSFNGGPNPETGGASYAYDGSGRRVRKVTAAGTTVFVYDAGGVLMAEYSTEPRQPDDGGTKYLTTDTLGSPRVITDMDGAVVSRHDYQPFGEELFAGRTNEYRDDGIAQQFTGQERDRESGLDYFDARYYSYSHGRFTSTDPLAASAKSSDPQSWNRYAYVNNNPLKYVDPTGMLAQPTQRPDKLPPPVPAIWEVEIVVYTESYVDVHSGDGDDRELQTLLGIREQLGGREVIERFAVGPELQAIADTIMYGDWDKAVEDVSRENAGNLGGFDEMTTKTEQSSSREVGVALPAGPNATNTDTRGGGTEYKIQGDRAARSEAFMRESGRRQVDTYMLTTAPLSNSKSARSGSNLTPAEAKVLRDKIYARNREIARKY
jgi:RHS repeat-associated protein